MTKIMLDATTMGKWKPFMTQVFELCDPSGNVLGHFLPSPDQALYQSVKVPFTDAELDSFEREPGGRALGDILKDLPQ
jgi:hypothetical protein